ncbi:MULTISPECIES: photosystem II complex extrinsic protein PsbU [Spirulina sp. CCY15215]|uniref:photosystem II complex extrinsic protein PsbU n=1 Tax=Spirulina sp. CCY15215 TaxID=2767591 RepID=UPI001950F2CC|nr:photosystem II complex extrinsic protein PsbU [Spirulina major]
MKNVIRVLAIALLAVTCLVFGGRQETLAMSLPAFYVPTAINSPVLAELRNEADDFLQTDFGQKIDLNNTNVRGFRQLKGFYPTLASKIVGNAPYESVEAVLDIPGLSESQKERLEANLDQFTVGELTNVFTQGDDRLNNGIYD